MFTRHTLKLGRKLLNQSRTGLFRFLWEVSFEALQLAILLVG